MEGLKQKPLSVRLRDFERLIATSEGLTMLEIKAKFNDLIDQAKEMEIITSKSFDIKN